MKSCRLILIGFLIVLTLTLNVQLINASPENRYGYWVKSGVVYITPSSPQDPYVLTPDSPPHSWWTQNYELFESQKQTDSMLLTQLLGNGSSRSIVVYFPHFLADRRAYSDIYLKHLESVITYFYEEDYQVLLFLGRPDYKASYGGDIDPIRVREHRDYLLKNIQNTIFYGKIFEYVSEVSVYWMGARYDWGHEPGSYTEEEVLEYNREIKEVINSAGNLFYVHVDGPWWEEGCVMNGYTPLSTSPGSNSSDGLFAESWAQGTLPSGLEKIIPEYFDPSEVLMCASIPNYDILGGGTVNNVRWDVTYWFNTIERAKIRSWYMWDYYGLEEGEPSYHSVINPEATNLTYKGHLVSEIARRVHDVEDILDRVILVQTYHREDFDIIVDGERIILPYEVYWVRGSNHTIEVLDTTVVNGRTRYTFKNWAGMINSTEASLKFQIQRPGKIVLKIGVYHEVMINSTYSVTPVSGWYPENASLSISNDETEIKLDEGVRALFDSWSGDVNTEEKEFSITVTSPIDVLGIWKTQYHLNVDSEREITSLSGWYDADSEITVEVQLEENEIVQNWIFDGTPSGSEKTIKIIMDSPHQLSLNTTKLAPPEKEEEGGISGIPGFPIETIIIGITLVILLLERKSMHAKMYDGGLFQAALRSYHKRAHFNL